MRTAFECPVCKKEDWRVTRKFDLYKPSLPRLILYKTTLLCKKALVVTSLNTRICKNITLQNLNLTKIRILRTQVLRSWFPNSSSKLLIQTVCCQECGFVSYSPRPDAADLDFAFEFMANKYPYSYFADEEETVKGDLDRANKIYSRLEKYIDKERQQVLDVGGGNGRLLSTFMQKEHSCYIVDYWSPLPGIKKLGNTIDDISNNIKFDIIMCNHVLEHLAEPAREIKKFTKHLSDNGLIYIEVPMQVTADTTSNNGYVPCVHINFFTLNSIKELFINQNFKVIDLCELYDGYGAEKIKIIYLCATHNEK